MSPLLAGFCFVFFGFSVPVCAGGISRRVVSTPKNPVPGGSSVHVAE
jgi:hypothetical protein